jgi:predicted nucleic acid-binding Zn ribbon protein
MSPTARACTWCGDPIPGAARRDAVFCSTKCRQTAWRLRRRSHLEVVGPGSGPGVFAYADPPYMGLAHRYYSDQPDYAGEVDHEALIASLGAGRYLGWALSCSQASLRYLLPLCPPGTRVCPWTKPIGVPPATHGLHNAWEPLLVVGGRKRRPGVRDWLRAQPARGSGDLMGRKPLAFCAWLFDCLGMVSGDQLVDLFPGTGIVTRAWAELSSRSSATKRRGYQGDSFEVAL